MTNHLRKSLNLLKIKRLYISEFHQSRLVSFVFCILCFISCTFTLPLLSQNPHSDKAFRDSVLTDSLFRNKIEIYFNFKIKNSSEINSITKIISIHNVKNKLVIASANKKEFKKFLSLNYKYTITKNPSLLRKPKMLSNPEEKKNRIWNFYPTYPAYETIMRQFVKSYPELCKLDTIAILSSGRKLLAIRINGKTKVGKPRFLYTSSMHGNETTGYILMLHLIDSLLSAYNNSSRITALIDNIDIFINPLANPDGTYAYSDSTIYGSSRVNANGVDLNRNYPNHNYGSHPDNEAWQTETKAFITYATKNHFIASLNFHTGVEVFNYPWDDKSIITADDNWWRCVGAQFADTIHKYNNGYFTGPLNFAYPNLNLNNPPGVTDGYAWYQAIGSRQDYMNYYQHCREATVELSYDYIPLAEDLPLYWNYTNRSLLNYIVTSLQGIHGIITDSITGKPVHALVSITGHDKDSSQVFSYLPEGDYHRLINGGTYNLTFSAPAYHSKTIKNFFLADNCDSSKTLNVILAPIKDNVSLITNNEKLLANLFPNPNNGSFKINFNFPVRHIADIKIFNILGKEVYSNNSSLPTPNSQLYIENTGLTKGLYFTRINIDNNFINIKTLIY